MLTDKITVITRKFAVNTYSSSLIVMNILKAYIGAGTISSRFYFIFTFIFVLFAQTSLAQNTYSLVRIPSSEINTIQELLDLGVDDDHGIRKINGFYECIVSNHALNQLKAGNIVVQTIVADMESFYEARLKTDYARFIKEFNQGSILAPKNFVSGTMGGYYTFEEIQQQMARIAQFASTSFIKSDTIGTSHENRPIIAWIFGKDRDAKKPRTLLTSLHHAREPGGATTLLYFLWDLFERAKENDPEALYLLNERTLVIAPCINPDGYAFNQKQRPEGGGLWRKNRKEITKDMFGVDLNRNYGPESFWNANNGGSSTDPKSDTYRGDSPFSEPETQAIRNLIDSFEFGCILNYHTYSNLLIYPFAALSQETKDSSTFRGFSADATRFNAYSAGRDLETVGYTTRGNSDDWAYYAHDALAFTPEVGAITDGFWPSPLRIIPHAQENLHMNYQALWSSGSNLCIRLAEVKIDSMQDPMNANGFMEIDVQNIGRLNLEEKSSIIVTSLRDDIKLIDSVITIPSIASGERIKRYLEYRVMNNYRNGDPCRFLVKRVQHGITRTDTVIVSLYHPTVFSLFTKASDTLSFSRNEWTATNLMDGSVMLEDSPGKQYIPEYNNYAEYSNDIDLNSFRQVSLHFETRWNIEPMSDFAIVQISTDQGKKWSYLRTSRMVKGSGIQDGKQEAIGFGFQGNMPEWEFQKADLTPYLKSKVRIRFGMLSDRGAEFDGFAVKNVRMIAYADSFSSIEDLSMSQLHVNVFPLPSQDIVYLNISRNEQSSPITFSVSIHDQVGREVIASREDMLYEKNMIIPIDCSGLSSGIYVIRIKNGFGNAQSITVPIIR
jgi:hypothetical protein